MIKRLIACILLCLFLGTSFVSCGGKSATADAVENTELEISEEDMMKPQSMMSVPAFLYNVCVIMKEWVAFVTIASIFIGCVVYDTFKKNREIQKWALSVLIFKIPIIINVVVNGYAILYSVYNL